MHVQKYVTARFRSFVLTAVPAILLGAILLAGCDLTEVEEDEPVEAIAILPDSASFSAGEQVEFSVVGITASGDTVRDAEFTVRWWSTDSTVFTVDEDGSAVGENAGEAFCKVEATSVTGAKRAGKTSADLRPFDGLDSAHVHIF